MKITVWLSILMLLGGCTAQQIAQDVMKYDDAIASRPAEYKQGFEEGCQSGVYEYRGWVAGDKFIRDDARMKSDADYALGWNDGARRCNSGGGSIFVMQPR